MKRVSKRQLDEVCLDCCDYIQKKAKCEKCSVNELKKIINQEPKKQEDKRGC